MRFPSERAAPEGSFAVADLWILRGQGRDGAVPLDERDPLLVALHLGHESVLRLMLGQGREARCRIARETCVEVRVETVLPGRQHGVERSGSELAHHRVQELGREGLVVFWEYGIRRGCKPVASDGTADGTRFEFAGDETRSLEAAEQRSDRNGPDPEPASEVLGGARPLEAEYPQDLGLGGVGLSPMGAGLAPLGAGLSSSGVGLSRPGAGLGP